MTKSEILNEFTSNVHSFKKFAYNIAGADDADDLFQTCVCMLLEFSEDRLISYYNPTQGLKPFFLRMLMLQYRSATSKFHADYRKPELNIRDKADDIILNTNVSEDKDSLNAERCQLIKKARQGIYDANKNTLVADLEQMVWDLYVEHGSLRSTLAAIPTAYTELFDLKTVHVLVMKFQRTIKEYLAETL